MDGTTFDTIEDAARENKVFEYIDIRDERLMHGSVVDAVNAILDEQDKENVDRDVAIGSTGMWRSGCCTIPSPATPRVR